MLTIKNIHNIKLKSFSFMGNEWILYGTDKTINQYTICYMPMQAGRYDTHNTIFVHLDRYLDETGRYKVHSSKGECYVDSYSIYSWETFTAAIIKNRII